MNAHLRIEHPAFPFPLCRLGLATRGNTHLDEADIRLALDNGINFLNWCGQPDALSRTIGGLGCKRSQVIDYKPPQAPEWYRFALQDPRVTVGLMAPANRRELEQDLQTLVLGRLGVEEYEALAAHGRRVRKHAGSFP